MIKDPMKDIMYEIERGFHDRLDTDLTSYYYIPPVGIGVRIHKKIMSMYITPENRSLIDSLFEGLVCDQLFLEIDKWSRR